MTAKRAIAALDGIEDQRFYLAQYINKHGSNDAFAIALEVIEKALELLSDEAEEHAAECVISEGTEDYLNRWMDGERI